MSEAKRKLRTASDVISRLKWDESFGELQENLVLGFIDRIHGPLEKCLLDYVPASQGGDIPEHRINYFRMGNDILWDRRSRLDKIFIGSGKEDATVCEATLSDVEIAQTTSARLADERQIKLEERIKRSQKRQRKTLAHRNPTSIPSRDRHVWTKFDTFSGGNVKPSSPLDQVSIVSWNVLFDLYDTEPAEERWRLSMQCVEASMADVVLLQEVTPSYARILLSCGWFSENYKASATLDDMTSVEPFGNLLLWKPNVFELASASSIYKCFDGDRNRAVLGVLQNENDILIVSNVHLPADHAMVLLSDENDIISPKERRLARQRERSAIIAKCQLLQKDYESKGYQVVCVMAGDFNIVEEIEVLDGRFSRFFQDSWSFASSERGYTFDPELNVRAISNKGPRRIDRIFVGDTLRETSLTQPCLLKPVSGSLLGTLDAVDADRCPSDHYGVRVDFKFNKTRLMTATSQSPKAWSCCTNSSCDTLLALCFSRDGAAAAESFFNAESSLPIAHLTMLHGFVELNSDESRSLAFRAVSEAVLLALEGQVFPLDFDESSLNVFEHRASASLVYTPTENSGRSWWLEALYSTLRAAFPQCDDQETRFDNGWCPHLTIGTYSTVEQARSAANNNPLAGKKLQLNAQSLGLFQRCRNDGKFYMVSAVPLVQNNPVIDAKARNISSFVVDSGSNSWAYFRSLADAAIAEVHRACQSVLQQYWSGLIAQIHPFGSYLLSSSIQGISDVDLVIHVSSQDRVHVLDGFDELHFFQCLETRLKQGYCGSEMRLRLAGAPGDTHFYILTAKLAPELPSMDMMVYVHAAVHLNSATTGRGSEPEKSIDDSLCILRLLGSSSRVFTQALRLIKAWAYRRQIYGSSVGFMGGGGWAVLLAHHMLSNGAVTGANRTETGKSLAASFFVGLPQLLKKSCVEIDIHGDLSAPLESDVEVRLRDNVPLHVWSPISRKNHARNSTKGTKQSMIMEAERARLLILGRDDAALSADHFGGIMAPLERGEVPGLTILALVVYMRNHDIQASSEELKAWLCRQALSMMLSLEREYGEVGGDVRPHSRPARKDDKLSIILAANWAVAPSFVARRKVVMQHEFQAAFDGKGGVFGEFVDLELE